MIANRIQFEAELRVETKELVWKIFIRHTDVVMYILYSSSIGSNSRPEGMD